MDRATGQDPVAELLERWDESDEEFVLVDLAGRHRVRGGRIDLDRVGLSDPGEVLDLLSEHGHAVLGDDGDHRSEHVAAALVAAQVTRTHTGHPRWIVLEDAQDLLDDPDLPPEALNLEAGGYALAHRSSEGVSLTVVPPRAAPDLVGVGHSSPR